MSLRRIDVLAVLVLCATTSAPAQRQWQELAADRVVAASNGTPRYLFALLERTAAMLNHDQRKAIEYAHAALTEAERQGNECAAATCLMQLAVAIADTEGIARSEAHYEQACLRWSASCPVELRIYFYMAQFSHDRPIAGWDQLSLITRKLERAVERCTRKRLRLVGEYALLEQRALASAWSAADCQRVRGRAVDAQLEWIPVGLDFQSWLTGRNKIQPTEQQIAQLQAINVRAAELDYRPIFLETTFHLSEIAATAADEVRLATRLDELLTVAQLYQRTDWIALAKSGKAGIEMSNENMKEAIELTGQACERLPAIDRQLIRDQIRKQAIQVYWRTRTKPRFKLLTEKLLAQDDHLKARQLKHHLNEMSRTLMEEKRSSLASTNRLNSLQSRVSDLMERNAELQAEDHVMQSEVTTYKSLSTVGIVTATCLAGFLFVSGRRLWLAHHQLQLAVERSEHDKRVQATLEARVAQAERMESLGALAGGVAHDLNSILVGVLCNAELLSGGDCDEKLHADCVNGIVHSALAASELSQKMLSYAGRVPTDKKCQDINAIVEQISRLLKSGLQLHCQLQLDEPSQGVYADVDKTQIEQVIMNLATNAAAVTEDSKESVVIRTGIEFIEDVQREVSLYGRRDEGGEFVFFEVEDHGPGIPEEQLPRIFEPFYSCHGEGQGLGLAVVYGHVVSHGGLIRCDSVVGRGTTIRILLPRSMKIPCEQAQLLPPTTVPHEGRIVIIDDEEQVLKAAVRTMALHRWEVMPFASGVDAVEHLVHDTTSYDCIVLDRCMPEMDGDAVLEELAAHKIEIPIVMMSGYCATNLQAYLDHPHVCRVLQKPFTSSQLMDAVTRAMAQQV